ncbi:RhtX/FptX family siderophore transporter [Achromobacter ruhlandii]|uniref:RhtX/FptX family siderophore transporter n=2 Tax=Achromobacter ruhlandii TaxID=72557 RepID=UPI001EED0A7A|nr:RhtX/FptX family siderophore transporter [Achromobacter ruhlandii]MCV6798716.1 RhtX/FptX family siderophore transporter [Achromobacter ruhlandii]MCV6811079.1 RhtX/FptX family siderophore transporter [Achromobacter ruhlandii]MCV6820781.1 RhtX/FptX family siderophore transporter [Achromobacter ruhlandii]
MIGALYFSQGIPLGVAMEALPTLLRRDGAPLHALAWLPLVGLPWVLKFLWAPQVDNRWRAALGRRRSWILPMQAVVLACLAAVAMTGIAAASAPWVVGLMALASLASATQDIATDGLTAERFDGQALARANAVQVGGTMVGFFAGGPGCLVLAGWLGQGVALTLLAAVVAFSLLMALGWREAALPAPAAAPRRATLAGFARRPGAWALVLAAFLAAMTAVAGYGLSKLFLVDAGWPVEAVGRLGMAGGAVTVLLGCGGGAWLVGRMGVRGALALGLAASGAAAAAWLAQAQGWAAQPTPTAYLAQALGSFGAGAASVALMTLAMRFAARGTQAGTDMTAVQSARDLGEILTSSLITALAARLGYAAGFGGGLLAAVATLAFVALALRRPG